MLIAIHYVIPALLLTGSLWLAYQEWGYFRQCARKPWLRFLRRILGAVMLLAIGCMMNKGDTTLIFMAKDQVAELAKQNPEYANYCLNYWLTVMALVLGTLAMAVWDIIASFISIRAMLCETAREDLKAFTEALEKSQKRNKQSKQKEENK
ncbi:MAG: hypothetical protein Q4F00_00025 [bacterium]|nr:hypothetical protein [bacterium]